MTLYTVQIEAANDDRTIWQALHPAENTTFDGTAQELADGTAHHQNIAEGTGWRVRVWEGADADTGVEPAAEYYPPAVTLGELTRRLGQPDHEQSAVLAWTGETDPEHVWSEAEAAELADMWRADSARIAAER